MSNCLLTPSLLIFLIVLLWGSMCCLIYIRKTQHKQRTKKAQRREEGGGSDKDPEAFIMALESKMDSIENRVNKCNETVNTNPSGEDKPLHYLYHDMYQDLSQMVKDPAPNPDGTPGKPPPIRLVDFKPSRSLTQNTADFSESLNSFLMMLRVTSEASSGIESQKS